MTDRGPTPHDALFRHVFSQPEHAAAELRHVLPAPITAAIDWDTLRVVPGTWVDAELRSAHADLLCSVQLAGHPALVYVLLEHKSGPDAMMPLQLRAMAALGRLALFCLRRIRAGGDLIAALTRWAEAMRAVLAVAPGGEALAAVLSYIMQVGDLRAAELQQFLTTEVDPEAEAKMTSTWEQIKQEGRAEGQVEVLIRLLNARFGELESEHLQIIRRATSEQLIEWAERVLDADSVDDVLAKH